MTPPIVGVPDFLTIWSIGPSCLIGPVIIFSEKILINGPPIIKTTINEVITDKPVLVGVGIGTPQQAKEVSKVADGCIVGSAIVQKLLDNEGAEAVGAFVGDIRGVLDEL